MVITNHNDKPEKKKRLRETFIVFLTEATTAFRIILSLLSIGAEEGTRTPTGFLPQPPQGCVSASFTTSAHLYIQLFTREETSSQCTRI